MEPLHFTVNRELKANSTINLTNEIVTELIVQNLRSGNHITLTDSIGIEFDCRVNKIGTGFVFRVLEAIRQ